MDGAAELQSKSRKKSAFAYIVQLIFLVLAFIGAISLLFLFVLFRYGNLFAQPDSKHDGDVAVKLSSMTSGFCNVAGIELRGVMLTYVPDEELLTEDTFDTVSSEDIVTLIELADDEPNIKAILVEVDSYGGLPVAAEEIETAIAHATKPVVAYIRSAGLSAAYWGVSSAEHIFASEISDIGSIGVTQSYVDNAKENEETGKTYNSISSGIFKDTGDPDKPLTEEERERLLRDVRQVHDVFVRTVAENRELDPGFVASIADGGSYLGAKALEYGLIDAIGGQAEALAYIEEQTGEPVTVCW